MKLYAPDTTYEGGSTVSQVEDEFEGGRSRKSGEFSQSERSRSQNNKSKAEKKNLFKKLCPRFGGQNNEDLWKSLSSEDKKARIKYYWTKAKRYNNKIRLQARLQKMSEQNLREMMIEDIQDDDDDETLSPDNQKRIKWYLIDTEKTFCKVWDFLITLITIYELFVVPIIMVFPELYVTCQEQD